MPEKEISSVEDAELERHYLSCVIVHPEYAARFPLPSDAISSPELRQVNKAIQAAVVANKPFDSVTLCRDISGDDMTLSEARALIARILDTAFCRPDSQWVELYLNRIKQLAYRRALLGVEVDCQLNTMDPAADPIAIEDHRRERIRRLRERYWPDGEEIDAAKGIENLIAFYQQYHDLTISTGYHTLDRIIGQLHPGSVVTILARTSVGKSYLASNLIANWLLGNETWGVYFASLEMGDTLTMSRLVRQVQHWDLGEIKKKLRSGQRPEKFGRLADRRLGFCFRANCTIPYIDGKIDAWERLKGTPVRILVIDYLQYLRSERNETPYQKTSRLTAEIKELAKRRNALVILLSQMRRSSGEGRDATYSAPTLESGRDSGSIEENADCIVGMWRDKQDKSVINLEALKCREGGNPYQSIQLLCDWGTGRITEEIPF